MTRAEDILSLANEAKVKKVKVGKIDWKQPPNMEPYDGWVAVVKTSLGYYTANALMSSWSVRKGRVDDQSISKFNVASGKCLNADKGKAAVANYFKEVAALGNDDLTGRRRPGRW